MTWKRIGTTVALAAAMAITIGCGDDDGGSGDAGTAADGGADAGTLDGGGTDAAAGDSGAADGGGDAGVEPTVLESVVVTVIGGAAEGHDVMLLDGSDRSATTDATGTVTFADVPAPYGLAATTLGDSPPAVLEYQGLTRADPTLVASTGFVTVGLSRTEGSASLVVPTGVTAPPADRRNIVGAVEVNSVVATDDSGDWSNRSLLWPGSAPLTTKLFGFYFHPGPRPVFISAGVTAESEFVDGMMYSGLSVDVDQPIPQEDHVVTIDFGSLDMTTPADVSLWAFSFGADRIPIGFSFNRNVLHTLAGHSGAPVAVDTTAVTAGTTWSARFGENLSSPDVQIVRPAAAGGTTAIGVDATRFVTSLAPASLPADLSTAPLLSWAGGAGADAIEVVLTADGLAYTAYRAIIPGNRTELDLAALWALSGALDGAGAYTVIIRSIYLPGFDADADADGTGRLLGAGGSGRLGAEDTFDVYRSSVRWE